VLPDACSRRSFAAGSRYDRPGEDNVLGDDTPVNVDKGNTPLGKGYDVLAVSSNDCNLSILYTCNARSV
jgi:hypothetical protein